ncbi:MAG: AraC family ligand binding domain-containing protein [Candidatus Spechtbacterales bacterium]|nr:AraC family ligand binding domain-containing protein [Candidatus Spechtbacterales bacterium]
MIHSYSLLFLGILSAIAATLWITRKIRTKDMYYKEFYKDASEEEIKNDLLKEGFSPSLLSHGPGYKYEAHSHPELKVLAFLEGTMEVRVDGHIFECRAGDKLIIGGEREHEATCGEKGCRFFWAEK